MCMNFYQVQNMLLFSLGLKHRENAVLGETYLIFITATKHTQPLYFLA